MNLSLRAGAGVVIACLTAISGCGDDGFEIAVDLKTDLVSGVEFAVVRTELTATTELPVYVGDDLVRGQRVAEFAGVARGSRTLRVTLVDSARREVVRRE